MPGLNYLLKGSDADLLEAFAQAWGLEDLSSPGITERLQASMQGKESLNEVISTLSDPAQKALMVLASKKGRMNWTDFTRLYGEVRVMGAYRREKEKQARHPQSTAEILWYRGLIGRAFFQSKPEAREFAYIPDEILAHLVNLYIDEDVLPGLPAASNEITFKVKSSDRILQDTCTLLSEFRSGRIVKSMGENSIPVPFLLQLLTTSALLDDQGHPISDAVKEFLEAPPARALQFLFNHWRKSQTLTDLEFVPDLVIESLPGCQPNEARNSIIEHLMRLPASWWNLESFVEYFHQVKPDFQRAAGDFDSWFIKSKAGGEYLRGFDSWKRVDGALIRFLVIGPLYWLGIIELASAAPNESIKSFRLSPISNALLNSKDFSLPAEDARVTVRSNGLIHFPARSSRAARYIVSRFCEWEPSASGGYDYRISTRSLSTAISQGLKIQHLLWILDESSQNTIPPTLKTALEKWERLGPQAEIHHAVILHISRPELLDHLKKSGRFIKKVIGPETIEITTGSEKQVAQELLEIGYLVDFQSDV